MATLAMFRAQFPEWNGAPDSLIAQMLAAAALEIDPSVWGAFGQAGGPMTKSDQGQMYLAAHKLAISPMGQNAKTTYTRPTKRTAYGGDYDRTTYGAEFLNLRTGVVSGFRVA